MAKVTKKDLSALGKAALIETIHEMAPAYPDELVQILEKIAQDRGHPVVKMETVVRDGEETEVLKIQTDNVVYHIRKTYWPLFFRKELYIFDPVLHFYRPDTGDIKKNMLAVINSCGPTCSPSLVDGIIDKIVNHTPDYPFGTIKGKINIINGVFDSGAGTLGPHVPGTLFDYVVATPYKEYVDTPELDEFLLKYGTNEPILILAKCLWQRCHVDTLKELTVVYGDKDTGKTTLMELVQATLDGGNGSKRNVSRVLLGDILQRFGMADLEHKLLNYGDDLPDQFIRHANRINEILGSVHHSIEKKGIDHYRTVITAYQVYSANQLPPLDDDDWVLWSKIRLVEFKNKFSRAETPRGTLYTEEIKQQLLFRAVQTMQSWKEKPYRNDQTADMVRDTWHAATDDVDRFFAECLLPAPYEEFKTLSEITAVYDSWCLANRRSRHIKYLNKKLQPFIVRREMGNGYTLKIIKRPVAVPDPAQKVITF